MLFVLVTEKHMNSAQVYNKLRRQRPTGDTTLIAMFDLDSSDPVNVQTVNDLLNDLKDRGLAAEKGHGWVRV